jgi:hypothetical protein
MIAPRVVPVRTVTRRKIVSAEGETREQMIRTAAYLLAQRRGFRPGGELEDWLAAEREIDSSLESGSAAVRPVRAS